MNRRQFTASLAALFAAPALPALPRAAVAAPAAVPPGAYAWAQLIARSQNRCSPAMLAKSLNLRPEVAGALFRDMVVDGVLRAPGASDVVQATQPFDTTGLKNRIATKARDAARKVLHGEDRRDEPTALVKEREVALVSEDQDHQDHKDTTDACTDQSPQDIPERG